MLKYVNIINLFKIIIMKNIVAGIILRNEDGKILHGRNYDFKKLPMLIL